MRSKILASMVLGLLVGPMSAQAAIVYEFSGAGFGGAAKYDFVYASSDFISSYRDVLPSALSSCSVQVSFTTGESCGGVAFDPVAGYVTPSFLSSGAFAGSTRFTFSPEAFSTVGTHNTVSDYFATLTVSGTAAPNPVPLPAAAWLLLSGLVGFGILRKGSR